MTEDNKIFRFDIQRFAEGEDDKGEAGKGKDGATGDAGATKTPEQVEAELRTKLEAEYAAKLQSEADKRVTDALKKAEEKRKKEEEAAKMTEDERRKAEETQREVERREKDRLLTVKEMRLQLVDILAENEMDLGFKELISVEAFAEMESPTERVKELTKQVKEVKKIFDGLVEKKVEAVKKEFLKGNTPNNLDEKGKTTPTTDYDKAAAKGDVRGMIAAKFSQGEK